MAFTATLHRLRRFVAALIVLALPLQGQAVASMACHTTPAGLAAPKATPAAAAVHSQPQTQGNDHGHAHQHQSGPTVHSHHTSSSPLSTSSAGASTDSAYRTTASHHPVALSTLSDPPGTPIDSMNAESCALCAAGCSVAAPLPTSHQSLSASITDHQQPTWHISSAYAGVVLDGLLRPPR